MHRFAWFGWALLVGCAGAPAPGATPPSNVPAAATVDDAPAALEPLVEGEVRLANGGRCAVTVDRRPREPVVHDGWLAFLRSRVRSREVQTDEAARNQVCPECVASGVAIADVEGELVLVVVHEDGRVSELADLGRSWSGRCEHPSEPRIVSERPLHVRTDEAEWEQIEECEDDEDGEEQCMTSCWIVEGYTHDYVFDRDYRRVLAVTQLVEVEPGDWDTHPIEYEVRVENGALHVTGCGVDETTPLPSE